MSETLNFSASEFDPSERFERYRDFYSYGADSVALGSPVEAEIEVRRLGGLILFERRVAGLGAERLAPRVRRNAFDHFTLQLNLRGEFHGEGDEGFRAVGPGEVLLLDMAKPMRTRMPDAHALTLALPRAVIESAVAATGKLHGLVIPVGQAAPLARFLRSAMEPADRVPRPDFRNAGAVTADLLGSALREMGFGGAARELTGEERLDAARRYIRKHLFDEALSPCRVARAAQISRATLYRLFEPMGGVRRYIQAQRLAHLKSRLSDPSERQSVTALAYDAGFASEHHACRAFRREFGVPPAEFRRAIQLSDQSRYGPQASALKREMIAWYSELYR